MTKAEHTKERHTAMMPVTTMEEVLLLSEEERTDMIAVLKSAEERIAAGDYVEHDPETFVDRLMDVRASAREKIERK